MPYHDHGVEGKEQKSRRIIVTKKDIETAIGNVGMHSQFMGTLVDVTIGLVAGALYGVIVTVTGRHLGISPGSISDYLGKHRQSELKKIIKRMQDNRTDEFEATGYYRYQGKNKGYVLTRVELDY